jgi:hypothetical protein
MSEFPIGGKAHERDKKRRMRCDSAADGKVRIEEGDNPDWVYFVASAPKTVFVFGVFLGHKISLRPAGSPFGVFCFSKINCTDLTGLGGIQMGPALRHM